MTATIQSFKAEVLQDNSELHRMLNSPGNFSYAEIEKKTADLKALLQEAVIKEVEKEKLDRSINHYLKNALFFAPFFAYSACVNRFGSEEQGTCVIRSAPLVLIFGMCCYVFSNRRALKTTLFSPGDLTDPILMFQLLPDYIDRLEKVLESKFEEPAVAVPSATFGQ